MISAQGPQLTYFDLHRNEHDYNDTLVVYDLDWNTVTRSSVKHRTMASSVHSGRATAKLSTDAQQSPVQSIEDVDFRQRSGSKGLRDLFRIRSNKPTSPISGEQKSLNKSPNKSPKKNHGGDLSPRSNHLQVDPLQYLNQLHPKTRELLMETFRQRSHSASSSDRKAKDRLVKVCGKEVIGGRDVVGGRDGKATKKLVLSEQRSLKVSGYTRTRTSSCSQNDAKGSLSPKMMSSPVGPEEFLEMYRNRAYTEPHHQAALDALTNVRMKRVSTQFDRDIPVSK